MPSFDGERSNQESGSPVTKCTSGRRVARRFCHVALGISTTCLVVLGAINMSIDPFWIYRGPWSSYWHPVERQLISRINKAEVAARDPIDVALLGDSRVLWGMDPVDPHLQAIGRTYNLGMIGTSIVEAAGMLDLLLRNPHQPKLVIWVISPEFVVYDRRPQRNFDYRLSRLNPDLNPIQRTFTSLWSRDATEQLGSLISRKTPDGPNLMSGYSPESQEIPVGRELFLSYIEGQIVHFTGNDSPKESNEMESVLRERFQQCAARGIRLEVIIPPSHTSYWAYLEEHGWGARVEAGKRCLTQIVAATNDVQSVSGSTALVRLWDFSVGESLINEPLPQADQPKVMTWHRDAVHFKPRLGQEIVQVILDQPDAQPAFGVALTPANLDSHLELARSFVQRNRDPQRTIQIVEEPTPRVH